MALLRASAIANARTQGAPSPALEIAAAFRTLESRMLEGRMLESRMLEGRMLEVRMLEVKP